MNQSRAQRAAVGGLPFTGSLRLCFSAAGGGDMAYSFEPPRPKNGAAGVGLISLEKTKL